MNLTTNTVQIPVDKDDEARFREWATSYGMTLKRKPGDGQYFTVTFKDPLDLYWLGANVFGRPPTSSLTVHAPANRKVKP